MRPINSLFIIASLFFLSQPFLAQEQIITINGKVIDSRIKKIGSNEITYKKYRFQMKASEIKTKKVIYVQYESGKRYYLNPITFANDYQSFGTMQSQNVQQGLFQPHYIERIGDNFRIDTNQIVNYKSLNSILAQCPDSNVQLSLKSAKLMRSLSTMCNIAATPASAGGAFASYNTVKNYIDMKRAGEEIGFKNYFGMGMSFLGTMALPITSAVLGHLKKKLYNKTLTLYSNYNSRL